VGGGVARTRVRPISSAKKQFNITDAILVVNGNQQYRPGNVRIEILPTAKPFGIFGEESSGRQIVVSAAVVRWDLGGGLAGDGAVPDRHAGGKRRVAESTFLAPA